MNSDSPPRRLSRITPAMVYDVTNVVALSAIMYGVWTEYGGGVACIVAGALALALNIFTLFGRR